MAEAFADAEIDAGRAHLDVLLGIRAGIEGVHGELRKLLRAQEEYERRGPVFVALQAAGSVDSGQDPLYLNLGGPAALRVWEVRQLVIGGATWATTVAGTAAIVVAPTAPSPLVGVGLSSIQDHAAALPSVAFYSSGQFRVRHPNHIYVAILLGTASTAYQVGGDAYDTPDRPIPQMFAE